jgi:TatA/E family protein of Tat protein translocase
VIAVIILGAGKLPQIVSGLGKAIPNFKDGIAEAANEMP